MAGIEIARKEDLDKKSNINHTHDWKDIENTPEIPNIEGLATKEEVASVESKVDLKSDSNHTHSWSDLKDKPTIPSVDGLASQEDLNSLQELVSTLQTEIEDLKKELEPEEPEDTE